ncbi:uncharacterized protein ACA1_251540 [Acanthamoeba castellanii str. Neff]|uniref:Uncharacterized protein n=1 Tax=Acanthamoeba castellanii (strain ATCC 30010 / Neff) TaxID=1257118 RepID=L8HAK0_ACACF|nr:uncharacterized protein ACA1_251540 [Acanthamoeba castellanii str. Neff]ELR22272.1 hypothetical protein ACA1_251540 [Acanthamoeba castellanii str. Neff]
MYSQRLLGSRSTAVLEAQRETRRIPIMQKWRAGAIKTRDQVHKKAERTKRNQERCEYQRVKLHLKQGTLYEYVEGKTADEETKRKWFHQHFGHVQPKSRLAEEVTTGSSSEGASSPPPQQQSFVDLDAESVRVSQ